MLWSAAFWKATAERAVSTFAQSVIAVAGVGTAVPELRVPWVGALLAGGVAAGLSVLKSLVAAGVGDGSPSITNAEKLP
jgi:hypothetical protein